MADFYSSEAGAYQDLWAPELIPLTRALLPHLPLDDAGSVLEAGAGVGTLLPYIRQAAPNAAVVGTDIAEGMIALAPRDFLLAVGDASRLPLRDGTFDVGILAFVLFHVGEPLEALREMRRVLRRGAVVATITWGADPDYRAREIWVEELDALGAETAANLARHELVDTTAKVEALLKKAGFAAPRTWTGLYENQMSQDGFLAHRIGHGSSRCRFESLGPAARALCVDRMRERLEGLEPLDFLDQAEVIYAVARVP